MSLRRNLLRTACQIGAGLVITATASAALVTSATAAASATTNATTTATTGPSRVGIELERQAIEARWRQAQAACEQRFAVTSCSNEAKSERRTALAVQREAELRLDDAERQQRARARRDSLAQKQADAASRVAPAAPAKASQARAAARPALPGKRAVAASSAGTDAPSPAPARASASASASSPAAKPTAAKQQASTRSSSNADMAAARALKSQQGRDAGQLRRDKIAQREAQHTAQRASDPRKGAALPTPPSASAP